MIPARSSIAAHRPVLSVLVGAVVALSVSIVGATITASSASAHDQLVASEPADGAQLATPPDAVRLTFSEEPLAVDPQVVVTGPTGAVTAADAPIVEGDDVVLALPDGLPGGAYTVAWRVVSADGHPIEGTFAYTVAGQSDASPSTASPTTAPTSTAATSTVDATSPTDASTSADAEPLAGSADTAEADDGGRVVLIVVALGLVAAAGVAAVVLVRRRGGRDGQ